MHICAHIYIYGDRNAGYPLPAASSLIAFGLLVSLSLSLSLSFSFLSLSLSLSLFSFSLSLSLLSGRIDIL